MSTDWLITVLKKRKIKYTHISTLIKMFAKLITGHMPVMIRMERC